MSQVVTATRSGERGIQAAGDADIERRAGGELFDSLGQSRALDAEDFGATAVELGSFRRHERSARYVALQALHRFGKRECNRRKGLARPTGCRRSSS